MRTGENQMLLIVTYYVFNCIAAILCIYIGQRIGVKKLKRALCKGCFYSIMIAAAGIIVKSGTEIRSTGFFNNPNQLGYYALLVLTMTAFFPDQLPAWQNALVLVLAIWANIVSLSKASVIGSAILVVCYTVWGSKRKSARKVLFRILILAVVFGTIYWFLHSNSSVIVDNTTLFTLRNRLLNMGAENDSQLGSGRGYDRIQEVGIHFLWGMGEGAYDRFRRLPGIEVHSSYINLLVSYGAVGFALYIWLVGKALINRSYAIRNIACFSGVLFYGITHNGIRNTMLWILIAAVMQASCSQAENPGDRLPSIHEIGRHK